MIIMSSAQRTAWLTALALTGAAAVLLLLLITPGQVVETQFLQDNFIFLEGAHRMVLGQVPNVDFHSPIGPLTYWLLGLGYRWSGGFGGMVPVATGALTLISLPILIYAAVSRMPARFGLPFGLFLLILAISPFMIGDLSPKPTFAMFYNRFGWALLCLFAVFVLPRKGRLGSAWLDGLALAALWLMMFYLKVTFAVIGLGLALAMFWFPHARRGAAIAVGGSLIGALLVELLWTGTSEYIRDISGSVSASGPLRGGLTGLFASTVNNFKDAYILGAIVILGLVRKKRLDYLLFAVVVAAGGIVLDRHNSQGPGIMTFIPAALIALLAPSRASEEENGRSVPPFADLLAVGALLVPVSVVAFGNLAYHFISAVRAPAQHEGTPLAGLVIDQAPSSSRQEASALSGGVCDPADREPLLFDSDRGQGPITPPILRDIALDGTRLIANQPRLGGTVLALDVVTPFNFMLGRNPQAGGRNFVDADINISEASHPPAEQMFQGISVVMVPRYPTKDSTFDLLKTLYRPFIESHFELAAQSGCWDSYRRRLPAAPARRG